MKNPDLNHCTDEQLAARAEGDSEAMYVLIARYTKWIRWKASQMSGAIEADDLAQEGFLGLLSAVAGYDANRNVKFSTYAAACITNSMRSVLRTSHRIPMPVGDTSDPVFETEDTAAQPDSIVMQREEWTAFWQDLIRQLSPTEYQVCMMFMGGAAYASIAEELHISVKTVDNALQRARRKLRQRTV
ncbi:MAG: sigma-70 family RNA polymerase sigma factor [Ruminococcus sp.]|nr:sigma-70 family RNA polymerase sigma factor [Ruminococcus sp.]